MLKMGYLKHAKPCKTGGNCITVYPRGQIAKIHLHLNTPENVFLNFFLKNLNEIVTLLQLHCNIH